MSVIDYGVICSGRHWKINKQSVENFV